jgi:hypothetical protein
MFNIFLLTKLEPIKLQNRLSCFFRLDRRDESEISYGSKFSVNVCALLILNSIVIKMGLRG